MAWIDDEGRIHRQGTSSLPQLPPPKNEWGTIAIWSILIVISVAFILKLGVPLFLQNNAENTQLYPKIEIVDFNLNVDEIELEYGEQFQLHMLSVYPENATVGEIEFEFESGDCLFINQSGLVTTCEYSNSKETYSTHMIVTVNGIEKRIPITVKNTYATRWSRELPAFVDYDGDERWSDDLVFVNPVPNCTGFTLNWTITRTDANAIGENWRVYIYSQYGWEHVGDIPIQELNSQASIGVSFQSRTLYGVVVYPPFGFSGSSSYAGAITQLQYSK